MKFKFQNFKLIFLKIILKSIKNQINEMFKNIMFKTSKHFKIESQDFIEDFMILKKLKIKKTMYKIHGFLI